jgi:hypothetical protein
MKKDQIKISNIVIQIADKKIELTLEQAKELQKILDDTFGSKEVTYIPHQPIIIDRYHPPYRSPWWEVTYSSLGGTGAPQQFGTLMCKATSGGTGGDYVSTLPEVS